MKCEVQRDNLNIAKVVLLIVLCCAVVTSAGGSKKYEKLDKLSKIVEKLGKEP